MIVWKVIKGKLQRVQEDRPRIVPRVVERILYDPDRHIRESLETLDRRMQESEQWLAENYPTHELRLVDPSLPIPKVIG